MQKQEKMNDYIAPEKNQDTEFWWEGVENHELRIQACDDCGKQWFPPVHSCPYCASEKWKWVNASGVGSVYSWVVYHRAFHPAFKDDLPYTVLTVKLAEGPRIVGRLIQQNDDVEVYADMQVKATFYERNGNTLLGFTRV
ncbi:Zn-ribbon domain-containing OB-fold protein [Alkalihalobacillus sp. BA299]|uniref:Zn-ribbon domain-containing OB-fold protein n=1 Tax=Alkalihalobacillus sp. BA299 TaxID=2815938 RepID=UPI001AD9EF48|nr:OB-fold domain-containing protein [Alkalihalobacillus sp. BA299]